MINPSTLHRYWQPAPDVTSGFVSVWNTSTAVLSNTADVPPRLRRSLPPHDKAKKKKRHIRLSMHHTITSHRRALKCACILPLACPVFCFLGPRHQAGAFHVSEKFSPNRLVDKIQRLVARNNMLQSFPSSRAGSAAIGKNTAPTVPVSTSHTTS